MSYTPSLASSTATLVRTPQPKVKDVPQRDYESAFGQLSATYGFGCHVPAPQPTATTTVSSSSSSFWKFGKKSSSSSKSSTTAPAEKRAQYPQAQFKDCEAALGDLMNTYGAPGGSAGPVSRHAT